MTATLDATGTALLRSVLEAPEDDAPRLVYADWVDEQGEVELAALIRVQCELARRGNHDVSTVMHGLKHCCGCGREQICKSCVGLRTQERNAWAGAGGLLLRDVPEGFGLAPRQGPTSYTTGWGIVCRGFIVSVSMPTAAFMSHATALFAAHPITGVRLTDRQPACGNAEPHWGVPTGEEDATDPCRIHPKIFDCLRPNRSHPRDMNLTRHYDTPADAHAALSRACVAYGRKLAGLTATKEKV